MDYLNKTVWATVGVSKIHGVGVIAIRDIPKGVPISSHTVFEPPEIYEVYLEEFEKLHPAIQKLVLDRMVFPKGIRKFKFYSPNQEQVLQSFMNHSIEPNVKGMVAMRDIKEGEELTENYLDFYEEGLHDINLKNFKV